MRTTTILGDAARGAVAGAVATWLMDLVTTGVVERQSGADRAREAAAQPNGQSSVANMIDRIESATSRRLSPGLRSGLSQAIHYGLGVVPGAIYGMLRRRVPGLAAGRGVAYGALLFLANDEIANTQLGLAGPYGAYPLSSHWRGFVGHTVLGVATDAGLDVLGA
jgi:hypothetical protein